MRYYSQEALWTAAQAHGRQINAELFDRAANERALLKDVSAALDRKRASSNGSAAAAPLEVAMVQYHSFRCAF